MLPYVLRLQDEYVQVQSEMKATIEETKLVQEKYKTLLDQAKKDLQAKQAECDALREQVRCSCISKKESPSSIEFELIAPLQLFPIRL